MGQSLSKLFRKPLLDESVLTVYSRHISANETELYLTTTQSTKIETDLGNIVFIVDHSGSMGDSVEDTRDMGEYTACVDKDPQQLPKYMSDPCETPVGLGCMYEHTSTERVTINVFNGLELSVNGADIRTRLSMVKRICIRLLGMVTALKPSVNVSTIFYDDYAIVKNDTYTYDTLGDFVNILENVNPDGGTNCASALEKVHPDPNKHTTIIMMGDGDEPITDYINKELQRLSEFDCDIIIVGIGEPGRDFDIAFLDHIASFGGIRKPICDTICGNTGTAIALGVENAFMTHIMNIPEQHVEISSTVCINPMYGEHDPLNKTYKGDMRIAVVPLNVGGDKVTPLYFNVNGNDEYTITPSSFEVVPKQVDVFRDIETTFEGMYAQYHNTRDQYMKAIQECDASGAIVAYAEMFSIVNTDISQYQQLLITCADDEHPIITYTRLRAYNACKVIVNMMKKHFTNFSDTPKKWNVSERDLDACVTSKFTELKTPCVTDITPFVDMGLQQHASDDITDMSICIICRTNKREVMFTGCRHLAVCCKCAQEWRHILLDKQMQLACPMCNRVINGPPEKYYMSMVIVSMPDGNPHLKCQLNTNCMHRCDTVLEKCMHVVGCHIHVDEEIRKAKARHDIPKCPICNSMVDSRRHIALK
jgi:hypothetical protein